MTSKPLLSVLALAAAAAAAAGPAHASAVDDLHAFVKTVRTGRTAFTQTVTSPQGKKKQSDGTFEFSRPNRFRFVYAKPYAQTLVGDGDRVWIYDPDLNQVSSRKIGDALGATPAALLVSADVERGFAFAAQPDRGGLQWVQATPKQSEGTVRWIKLGFKDHVLAALEIADSFGQDSMLVFQGFQPNAALPADTFVFTPPKGADVVEQ